MNIFLILGLILTFSSHSQDNCQFNYYNKKGGHYLFSTYFESDMHTRLEDTCQTIINGKIYERRIFKNGHIIEETLNNYDGSKRSIYKLDTNPKDSIISTLVSYWETGNKNLEWIFYLNKDGRRCSKEMNYHHNGKVHTVNFRAWVKISEISEYEKKDHPEHTVDDEGYTYLAVPIGAEETYHENGKLASRYFNKFLPYDNSASQAHDGPFVQYYENGQLHVKGQYKNGRAEGKFLNYHMTGEISGEKYFKHEMPVGTWKGWHQNGKPWYIEVYDTLAVNPFVASESKYWDAKGLLLKDYKVDRNGTGYEKAWYTDGKPMFEEDITNYQRYWGVRKDWFPDGKLWKFVDRDPKADTAFMEYFTDGKLKFLSTNTFFDTVQEHKQKEWYANGILKRDYSNHQGDGNDISVIKSYYPSGVLENISEYGLNKRAITDFYQNSQKKRSVLYEMDKIEGSFQVFDSLGQLREDMNYRKGFRHGLCRKYDASGKLIFERRYVDACSDPLFKTIKEPKRRNFREITPGLHDSIYGTVIEMYQRMLQFPQVKEVIHKQQIDSTCQEVLYLYDEWKLNEVPFDFPFSRTVRKMPVLKFTLPLADYKGLEIGDYSKPMVKKLKAVFDSLGWDFPKEWKMEGNNLIGTWEDGNIYSYNLIYRTFTHWYNYGQMQYEFGWMTEIDYGLKYRPYYSPQLGINYQLSNSCVKVFQITGYTMNGAYPSFCVYQDGAVEIYNRTSDWEELKQAEFIPDMFRD